MKKITKQISTLISLFFLVILFLSGCVPSKPTEDIEILPAERLMNKLEVNRRRIESFEGYGTLNIKSDLYDNKASFNVVLIKPDSIYLTIMGPFGIELAQALVSKDDYIFYDALENTAYEGKVNDEVLKNIFKIDLSFNNLLDAFVGSVNLTEELYKSPADYNIDDDQYVITYYDSLTNNSTQYKVDIRQLGITSYQLKDQNGNSMLEGKYSEFTYLENVPVPYHIEVWNRKENQHITIDYKNMRANKNDIAISFNLPADASIIKW